jgi:hypothetical protein
VGVVDAHLFTDEVIDLAKRTYDDIFQLIGVMAPPATVDRLPRSLRGCSANRAADCLRPSSPAA